MTQSVFRKFPGLQKQDTVESSQNNLCVEHLWTASESSRSWQNLFRVNKKSPNNVAGSFTLVNFEQICSSNKVQQ